MIIAPNAEGPRSLGYAAPRPTKLTVSGSWPSTPPASLEHPQMDVSWVPWVVKESMDVVTSANVGHERR